MSAKLKYTIVILAALLVPLGVEFVFAFDKSPDTPPYTQLIVDNVLEEIAIGAIAGFAAWFIMHLHLRYKRKGRDSG